METLNSPRMLLCSIRCSCLVSLALTFFVVCNVRVKGSRVSPGCHFILCVKIKSSWQECRESHSHGLVSCNSRSRISPNALGKSVSPAYCLKSLLVVVDSQKSTTNGSPKLATTFGYDPEICNVTYDEKTYFPSKRQDGAFGYFLSVLIWGHRGVLSYKFYRQIDKT